MKTLTLSLCLVSLLAGCRPAEEAEPSSAESMAIEGFEDDAEASQASLDASEMALGGGPAFGGPDGPTCSASVTGTDVIDVCGRTIPGSRTVSWSCTGADASVSGTATVLTTVVDATACPSVAIRHDVTFSRTRTAGLLSGVLEGDATVDLVLDADNRTAQRTVALDVTRRVHRDEELIRDQHLTGERVADFAANGIGPEDDTRTVNGSATIEFLLAQSQLDVGATDLLWQRGCCHPVGGRIDWVFSGERTGSGSLEFGPSCGTAQREDDSTVTLRPCPLFD